MNNQEMMERFTPVDAAQVAYFYGSAGQTGEGILMAEAIGAAVYEKARGVRRRLWTTRVSASSMNTAIP